MTVKCRHRRENWTELKDVGGLNMNENGRFVRFHSTCLAGTFMYVIIKALDP